MLPSLLQFYVTVCYIVQLDTNNIYIYIYIYFFLFIYLFKARPYRTTPVSLIYIYIYIYIYMFISSRGVVELPAIIFIKSQGHFSVSSDCYRYCMWPGLTCSYKKSVMHLNTPMVPVLYTDSVVVES